MSIIRVGLAETKNFSDGYDLIFGKKEEQPKQDEKAEKKEDEKVSDAQQKRSS